MADNEVTVRIVTETETTQVDDLKTSIDEIQSGADSASTSVDQLSDSAANVNTFTNYNEDEGGYRDYYYYRKVG